MRFAAFLRGVNVGKHQRVTMAALRSSFEAAGLSDVSTFLQSGNVLFSDREEPPEALGKRVESALGELGLAAVFVLRSSDEMGSVVANGPFGDDGSDDSHRFVTFLGPGLRDLSPLPSKAGNGAFEILRSGPTEVYSVARLVGGRYGAPNAPIEAMLKVPATTRNWGVVKAVADLLKAV